MIGIKRLYNHNYFLSLFENLCPDWEKVEARVFLSHTFPQVNTKTTICPMSHGWPMLGKQNSLLAAR
jgi:hypothetical protein